MEADRVPPADGAGESQTLVLVRIQDTRPKRLDSGRIILRPCFPYDHVSRMTSCFLDLYIGACYAPSAAEEGCVCRATVLAGTVILTAEGQTFQLMERDSLRFAADQPCQFENRSNGAAKLLLDYQFLKGL